jgi:hydrogenase nickel incorporation protein HypA/HybF
MHESSLAQSALDLVLSTARTNGAERVTAVRIAVGDLAQADGDTVAFWFGILAEGTEADGAEVTIERVKASARCKLCGNEFDVLPPRWAVRCPACGGDGELSAGRDLRVTSIDVED